MVALIALIPAIIGLGFYVAAFTNHRDDFTAVAQMSYGTIALSIAGSLALLWLLVGAINWQIKEATRHGGRS